MLQRWFDQLRRKASAQAAPMAGAMAAPQPALTIERLLAVAVAAADPTARHGALDALEGLAPRLRVIRHEDAEGLSAELQLTDLDLVVLDLGLIQAGPGPDSLWARLTRARPRLVIVAVATSTTPAALRDDARTRPGVAALLDTAAPDFNAQMRRAIAKALTEREGRRDAADAHMAAGFQRAETHPATGARSLLEAYRSGDLGIESLDRLRTRFATLLTELPEQAPERADILAALTADAFERHDEIGLVYHASLLAEAAPERANEAEVWLARRDELTSELYAAIDRRLEHVMVLRRIGRFRMVKRECDAIHAQLANVLPAYHLEAEALRNEGHMDAAMGVYESIADLCLQNGEVDRARQALATVESIDPSGEAAKRVRGRREVIDRIEDALADAVAPPRYPCMRVCSRVMCQEAAEATRGFFVVDPEAPCDVCDLGILGRIEALHGRTIAIVGGRLGRFYAEALKDLGCAKVLYHDAITEPGAVPGLIAQADAVVLVTGPATHWGILKADRELARVPRPVARVHFYGVRQVARAVALDLAPKLAGFAGTGPLQRIY